MIDRYTRKEMGDLWNVSSRFTFMLQVEKALAQVQGDMGIIPKKAAQDINKRGAFKVENILKIEKQTKHDVIAFVTDVAEHVGKNGRYVHFGLTSSDVLDTALSVQIQQAGKLIFAGLDAVLKSLAKIADRHKETICAGRTHGMHAEPTSFGLKMLGFYAEFQRHKKRLEESFEQLKVGKLSGAVGTYSALSPQVEKKVCAKLGLKPETVATQVIPRDRHADLYANFALLAGGIERLAVELRHLQRTELLEVLEGFSAGQKGSSAMPHKKNPISAENLTGISRMIRSFSLAAFENMALWHERDISHSSVERVIFPDGFILVDYALHRLQQLLEGLQVQPNQMRANMLASQGQLFSSHVLLLLVEKGLTREQAYSLVQSVSHGLKPGQNLKSALLEDVRTKPLVTEKELETIFSGAVYRKSIVKQVEKVLKRYK